MWNDKGAIGSSPERFVRYRWAARLTAGGRVLDAACGGGWGTALLARDAEAAVGVDFSPPALAKARQDHGAVAEFREGDLRDLPFEDEEFDHVVCFEAIAHVEEPETVLDELRRVLKPRGLLLVSSPNRGVYPPGNPLHLKELTSAEFEAILEARFANVAVHRQQAYFASLLGPAALLAREGSDSEIDVGVTKLLGTPPGDELYAVAAATDGDLPPEPGFLTLGEDVDYVQQRRALEEWQQRAIEAESEVLALRRRLRDFEEESERRA